MYQVYYKYNDEPVRTADFESEQTALEFANDMRAKGYDAIVNT